MLRYYKMQDNESIKGTETICIYSKLYFESQMYESLRYRLKIWNIKEMEEEMMDIDNE